MSRVGDAGGIGGSFGGGASCDADGGVDEVGGVGGEASCLEEVGGGGIVGGV